MSDLGAKQAYAEPATPLSVRAGTHDENATLREIRQRLTRAIGSVCPAAMNAHSEDIVQLAMLRVAKVRSQGLGNAPLPASYLWRVAYSTTIDELRKLQSRQRTVDGAAEASVAGPRVVPAPDTSAEAQQLGTAIRACLCGLAENRRRAVNLYLQGHTVPETGSLLGWTRKRTENLVFRGLADLRNCLHGKGFSP
ncbi:MAG: RNA polymerase sigma factor [Nannocystales bacterium]